MTNRKAKDKMSGNPTTSGRQLRKRPAAAAESDEEVLSSLPSKKSKKSVANKLTEADRQAIFKEMTRKALTRKKALEEKETQDIRSRNQDWLDKDVHDSVEDVDGVNKEVERTTVLDDEEAALAEKLPGLVTSSGSRTLNKSKSKSDWENEYSYAEDDGYMEDDSYLHYEKDGSDLEGSDLESGVKEVLENEDDVDGQRNGIAGVMKDNELSIKIGDSHRFRVTPTSSSRTRSVSRPGSSYMDSGNSTSRTSSGKITESDFPAVIRDIAVAAKSYIRTSTIYVETFPPSKGTARMEFAWNSIVEMTKNSKKSDWRQALEHLKETQNIKKKLITYTLYGRVALVSSIISKAREKIKAFYGFGNDQVQVKSEVEWLIKDGHFIFGAVNIEKRTFDGKLPFGSELMIEIIQTQWFPHSNRMKSDSETTLRILKSKSIPQSVIFLTLTAIEHALKEWSHGIRPIQLIPFSDEGARKSFNTFQGYWLDIETRSKKWVTWWPGRLFQITSGEYDPSSLVPMSQKTLSGVDIEALEALANAI